MAESEGRPRGRSIVPRIAMPWLADTDVGAAYGVARVPHDRLEGARGLRPDRGHLVMNGPRGELDAIPGQDVRGNELGERLERAPP